MKLGDAIKLRNKNTIEIEDEKSYEISGVQNYGKGVVVRRRVLGQELTMRTYQVIESNQLMWCKVDTKNGAFGVTHSTHAGTLASGNMALADINLEKVDPTYLETLFRIPAFADYITKLSSGTTNRKYLTPKNLLNQVELPDLDLAGQQGFVEKLRTIEELGMDQEIDHQRSLLKKLKQAILQEAIQGKLTADWRAENLDVEPASELLKRIQVEKARLVAEKKIRKEKPLPKVTSEEITCEIPDSWEWCRLGELTEFVTSGSRGWKAYYANQGSLFIRAQNIKTDLLDLSQSAFVDLPDKMEGQRTLVQPDDILVTITGGNCGKTARVDQQLEEAYVSQHIALTRLMETKLSVWIHRCLTTDNGPRGVLLSYSKGDKPGLNLPNVRTVPIPLPPLAEQAVIVERVDALMETCRELEAEIEHSQAHANQLLQAVLKEAFAP
ncbi:restriction endonuclease subunit S [Pelagicoccus sp. SDUM812005]|uniref:restriction endonuclease subunit S n=1 Tax=Pelagicoccus sp. SDUM812005 TaxID=3041257 RepID=UPI002810192F|nr:restriction endonuclease subunit S [Pelagicoccus sp. SDUM812005]MDQ8180997.1 restriction endonuclease subunit S [Pelagicoccus sp. SDUM812005]